MCLRGRAPNQQGIRKLQDVSKRNGKEQKGINISKKQNVSKMSKKDQYGTKTSKNEQQIAKWSNKLAKTNKITTTRSKKDQT